MDRPTFSQSWSRVSRLTPTLRPQVAIHRQLFRGEPWHVLHDPVTNNFFRLNPVAYHFVGLLDGHRSVDDAWRLTLEKFGDYAPTQNEVIGLLGQLNESNLLRVDLPADAAPLLKRQRRRRMRQIGGQMMSVLSLKFPIFNPDRMLTWLLPLFRPFLNKWMLLAWVAWMVFCAVHFFPHLGEFTKDPENILAPDNWGWMALMFLLVKAWHELGHGLVCRRLGGPVPEVGIMLLVLFPCPYVDATSSWNFPSKWKRLLVSAAGMIFELGLAGLAALVWLNTTGLPKQLASNVVILASVTTILFNGNPLLRFDGYYMLSDAAEIPNLYERAGRQLRQLAQRYLFGMTNLQAVSSHLGERIFLAVYGVLSQIYRVFIMFSIAIIVALKVPTLGILIALWSLAAWAVIPACKFVHWLATSPALHEHRARAVMATLAVAALLALALGVLPVDDHRRAQGVVESVQRAEVAIQTDGFVQEVQAEVGSRVEAGQVLLVADSPTLRSRERQLLAQLQGLEHAHLRALSQDPVEARINHERIEAVREQLADVQRRLADLTVRAPQAGTLVGPELRVLEGQFLRRGQVITRIEDLDALRVTAMVDQAHNASPYFNQIRRVELRSASDRTRVLESRQVWVAASGRTELPHPALTYAGGGSIAVDPHDQHGRKALRPQFELWLALPRPFEGAAGAEPPTLYPGQRVYVRFTLDQRRPLAVQWLHRLRQVVGERLGI